MKNSSIISVVVALVVIAGLVWWIAAQPAAPAAPVTDDTTQTASTTDTTPAAPTNVAVTYGPDGFSPKSVTVAKGGTVTFTTLAGASPMWVASAQHPSHTGYDGTARAEHCTTSYSGPAPFDQCAAGTSFSFTFDKAGTWPYHNHSKASDFGTIVVVE